MNESNTVCVSGSLTITAAGPGTLSSPKAQTQGCGSAATTTAG